MCLLKEGRYLQAEKALRSEQRRFRELEQMAEELLAEAKLADGGAVNCRNLEQCGSFAFRHPAGLPFWQSLAP